MKSSSLRKITLEGRIKLGITTALLVYSIIVSCVERGYVCVPMLFSFCGDISLMKKRDCFNNRSEDDFRRGVLFFMLAHISYAIIMRSPEKIWIIDCMIMVAMLLMLLSLLEIKKDIIAITLYGIVLTLSAINMYHYNMVSFIGIMLFVFSDFLIALFMLLKKDEYITQVLIWVIYVPAQILILTSFLL